jgi:hypothetical protein
MFVKKVVFVVFLLVLSLSVLSWCTNKDAWKSSYKWYYYCWDDPNNKPYGYEEVWDPHRLWHKVKWDHLCSDKELKDLGY